MKTILYVFRGKLTTVSELKLKGNSSIPKAKHIEEAEPVFQ